jgi:hypothetical protein
VADRRSGLSSHRLGGTGRVGIGNEPRVGRIDYRSPQIVMTGTADEQDARPLHARG